MGFYLRCAIARVDNDAEAERVVTAMTTVYPPFVTVRRFSSPFTGVIAAHDPSEREDDLAWVIDEKLPQISHELGALPVAFVDVDCFGGTCMYGGHVMRDGAMVAHEPRSTSAHVRLFAHLGVDDPQWQFAPFSRGFLDTGIGADRLPVTFHVHARWDEPFRLAAIRATMLPSPWKVTMMTERDCVVVYGEQFVASINTIEDHVELNGKSFADLTLTKTLAGELADDDIALELKDADGKPL